MLNFKDVITTNKYKELKINKYNRKFFNISKRSLLYGGTTFDRQLYIMYEQKESECEENENRIINNMKHNIYDDIFLKKKDKNKKIFINYNCILSEDLLGEIYDYYNESKYIIAIKIKDNNSFFLTTNQMLIKNIYLNNNINQIYRINIERINDNTINYFDFFSKKIFDSKNQKYDSITKIISNNDFYAPIICLKIFYYKDIKKIKNKKIYITNYNNMYFISDFFKKYNNKIANYELYYLNKLNHIKKNYIKISYDEIKKYNILTQINDYMINLKIILS